jgi:HSP20 family protein
MYDERRKTDMATKDIVRQNGETNTALNRFLGDDYPSFPNLYREMTRRMEDWDSFLSDFAGAPWNRLGVTLPKLSDTTRFTPAMDIREGDSAYTITAELPGIDPKDVEITIQEGMLLIKGEKKFEQDSKGEGYHRMERSYGSFRRAVNLPKGVDVEHIDATFTNGLLNLTIPKLPELKPQARKIEIKTKGELEEPAKK